MKTTLALTIALFTVGCASSNKVKEIDDHVIVKGIVQNQILGIDGDDRAVLQQSNTAADELEIQIWRNSKLELDLDYERGLLKSCMHDLEDPRLGGDGNIQRLPARLSKTPVQMREEFGLVGDQLKVVKREYYLERLKAERTYHETLTKLFEELQFNRESCEAKMGHARLKAGLPFGRIQGKMKINAEGNIEEVVKEHENSLDDAFRIVGKQ